MDWRDTITGIAIRAAAAVRSVAGTARASRSLGAGAGGDETMHVDRVAEDIILEGLAATGHRVEVFTEERGELVLNDEIPHQDTTWRAIIDPVDGSYNASRGIPFVAVSIAMAGGPLVGDIQHGVVVNVSTGEVFSATRGEGAWRDGCRLSVDPAGRPLEACVLGVDLNPKAPGSSRMDLVNRLAFLLERPRKIRVLGSNALGTCLVASGALDLFADLGGKSRLLDIAAAYLIVIEAGGQVLDWRDGELHQVDSLSIHLATPLSLLATAGPRVTAGVVAAWKEF